jgi:hypothetical protein
VGRAVLPGLVRGEQRPLVGISATARRLRGGWRVPYRRP